MKRKIKVMIAEDEELLLNSLCRNIQALDDDFTIIGTAQNGKDLLEMVEEYTPDVIFTDIQMPQMNGLQLIKYIDEKYPRIIKVIVSGYDRFEYARTALRFNVMEYMLKPIVKTDLKNILNKIKEELNWDSEEETKVEKLVTVENIILEIEEIIKQNYKKEIDFAELAATYHYNDVHLSRLFKSEIGMSPAKYITMLRMEKASKLLKNNPKMSVAEIGSYVGYSSPMYFNRAFKSYMGNTPGEYRTNG